MGVPISPGLAAPTSAKERISILDSLRGLAMFGRLDRHEIYYVVGAVWVFQIICSNIWLRYFRFGPCEWLWRSLTYWEKQLFIK
jgi:uncharacterized membrane protein YeiB